MSSLMDTSTSSWSITKLSGGLSAQQSKKNVDTPGTACTRTFATVSLSKFSSNIFSFASISRKEPLRAIQAIIKTQERVFQFFVRLGKVNRLNRHRIECNCFNTFLQ